MTMGGYTTNLLQSADNTKLDFDLEDDLLFFMNNDPDFYRKQYYPVMLKFNKYCNSNRRVKPVAFSKLVNSAYEAYKVKFPVEKLPDQLDKELCETLCTKIHEDETKNCNEGIYD